MMNVDIKWDTRSLPYLHWWTFLGAFGEIGEGLFSQVVHLRHKLSKGEKLSKTEKEFIRKNDDMVRLRTSEEKAEIERLEKILDKLT